MQRHELLKDTERPLLKERRAGWDTSSLKELQVKDPG